MNKLEFHVEDINSIDENHRDLYSKTENGYELDKDKALEKLYSTAKHVKQDKEILKQQLNETNQKLSQYEKAQQEAIQKAQQEREEALRKAGQFEELHKLESEKLTAAQEKAQSIEAKYQRLMIENEVNQVVADTSQSESMREDLALHIFNHARINEGNVEFILNGNVVDKKTLIEHYRVKKPHLFNIGAPSGGGARGSQSSGTQVYKRSSMTHAQMAEFIADHGQEAYLKLPK